MQSDRERGRLQNQRKVEKIAKTFGANVFSYDANSVDADIRQVEADLGDRTRTMRMTRDHIQATPLSPPVQRRCFVTCGSYEEGYP